MTKTVAVLVGSIRKGSLNRKLAQALEKLAEGKLKFDHVRIDDLPFYNEDLWQDTPAAVSRFKAQVAAADAILIVSPEYNRTYPGILANAFEWGSRPSGKSVWARKPAAVTGTSPGAIGSAVGQAHLRGAVLNLATVPMHAPEAYIQWKPENFADDGSITDESTRNFLQAYVDAFAKWIDKHQ